MNTNFLNSFPLEVNVTFRLLLAYLLGSIIGWERQNSGQEAGLRTHLMVVLGSAGFTLAFIYGFTGVGTSQDVTRSVSQIIIGIGFIGAGAIWQTRQGRKRGITTAADLWVIAAIGLAAGAGLWYIASLLTILAYITLRILRPLEMRTRTQNKRNSLRRQQKLRGEQEMTTSKKESEDLK